MEYPLLAIDTASRRTWVGLKLSPNELTAKSEAQDPSNTLFRLIDELLAEAEISLETLASIAFCAGPGSMLGARTAAMAIRTWKGIGIRAAMKTYTYNSLQIGSLIASRSSQTPKSGLVVTDARRSSWNTLPYPAAATDQVALVTNEDLETSANTLVTLSEFPRWTKSEAALLELTYDPTPFFDDESFLDILELRSEATPLTVRANEFKKWEAKIHSTPET